uniref:Cytoskeleton-associated protein 2 C-terminal domain-containing protein n=1 Tax=Xiphophorus couchianus TaxID=32473 RepID=A0A3B5LU94_9TELE
MGKENKAPPDKIRWHNSKDKTLVPQRSQDPPRRRALGVSDKGNVTNGNQTAICSSSSSVSAQTNVNQNPLLRKTYTVLSSKSSFTPAATQQNQPNTGSRNLSKVQLNGHCTHAAKSEPKPSKSSSRAALCPLEMASSRISTGPLVKTKTGLVPAAIQPRNPKSNASHPPGSKRQPFTFSTVAKNPKGKGQLGKMSSVSASQRPAVVIPTNSRARSKTEAQNRSKPKPLPVKLTPPTGRSQLWTGLHSAGPSKCKTVKPEQSVLTSKTAGQPAHTSKTQVKKNTQSVKADAPTTSRPSIKRSSTAVKTNESVWSKDGRETKTNRETQIIQKTSRNISSGHLPTKCAAATRGYRTAPQPSRSISLLDRTAATKTPKVMIKTAPQTEVKKLTAPAIVLHLVVRRKLQEWRESKGISYKRPPMPVKAPATRTVSVPQPFWASMELEDEAHSLICAVDRSLEDCIKLLAEGCPADRVKDVLSRLPAVSQKFAKYWICRARLMEQEGNLDVLPMFEEAVRVVLEVRIIDCFSSLRGPASQQKETVRVKGQEVRFFTPVRRSVRIERSCFRYPPSLQDHDVCVNSYSDLISEEGKETSEEQSSCSGSNTPMYIYRQNEALEDKVSIKLVLNDSF